MKASKRELVLAATVMLLLPLVAEFLFRVAGIQFEAQLYIADEERGWALRPNAEGVVRGETKQYVRINSHGFRDAERSYEKPADTTRIVVLGNSWTEALQVPLDKTYCSLIEHELQRMPCFSGRHVEVLNFGVSGYSTAQELITLRQEVWKYHPDIVVVAFYSARDIANNLRELNNAADPAQSPYFVYRAGLLTEDNSFRLVAATQTRQIKIQKLRAALNDHVRVLQAINVLVRYGRKLMATATVKERAKEAGVADLEHSIYAPPSQGSLQEAWSVTEALLLAMRDDAQSHNAEFRVITLANRPQVIPDSVEQTRFMHERGLSQLSYADERIKALGSRENFKVINLAPPLAEYARAHQVYLNGFNQSNYGGGHWNETGHRLAAEVIAASWCQPDSLNPSSLTETTPTKTVASR